MFSSRIYASWEALQRPKYEALLMMIGRPLGRVLDIGCGPGFFPLFLQANSISASVVGIDIDLSLRSAPCFRAAASGDALPFRAESFDTIVAIDSLHLFSGNDFARVLRKGGIAACGMFIRTEEKPWARLAGFRVLGERTLFGREKEYLIVAEKV